MKRCLIHLFVLLIIVALVGCNKKGSSHDPKLVGIWQLERFELPERPIDEIEFFRNGTAIAKDKRYLQMGIPGIHSTWETHGNRIIFIQSDQAQAADYKISGSILTFIYDSAANHYAVYRRISQSMLRLNEPATELATDENIDMLRMQMEEYGRLPISDLVPRSDFPEFIDMTSLMGETTDELASDALAEQVQDDFLPLFDVDGMVAQQERQAAEDTRIRAGTAGNQFDFYNVLPRDGDTLRTMPTVPPRTADRPRERYYLQAGAFRNAQDADNLKASLALMGVEAQIQTIIGSDNTSIHRVRVGPISSRVDAEAVQRRLSDNRISADIIQVTP